MSKKKKNKPRELIAAWKPRKKKGGFRMKWTFKKAKDD